MMRVEFTDPATEVGGMVRTMLSWQSNDPTWVVLSQNLGVDADDVDFLEILSIARRRIHNLRLFSASVYDPDFDEEQRSQVVGGLARVINIFHPNQMIAGWNTLKKSIILPNDALSFIWFGNVARRYRPLRRLTKVEREDAGERLRIVSKEISLDDELPNWVKEPLLDGLRRVSLAIRHLEFVGHEHVFEELVLTNSRVVAIRAGAREDQNILKRISQVAAVVAGVVTLFTAPDEVTTAITRYQSWSTYWSANLSNMAQGPLLLTGPSAENGEPAELPESIQD